MVADSERWSPQCERQPSLRAERSNPAIVTFAGLSVRQSLAFAPPTPKEAIWTAALPEARAQFLKVTIAGLLRPARNDAARFALAESNANPSPKSNLKT
jgi:hypothetical protein